MTITRCFFLRACVVMDMVLLMTACRSTVPMDADSDLASYVNPMIGASTSVDAAGVYHGLGKTFPGATTPFGMVQVSPNTITGGDNGSGYSDEHRTIEGFAMTQMSGVGWYGDLGNFLVMPTSGEPIYTLAGLENGTVEGWRSPYDKATETAEAGYYSASLTRYGIHAECTATTRSGFLRFTYPESEHSRIQIDLARRVGGSSDWQSFEVLNDTTFCGHIICTPDGGGWGNGEGQARYTIYFYGTFSKPMTNYGFWSADIPADWNRRNADVVSPHYLERVAEASLITGQTRAEGCHLGFFTEFVSRSDEAVTMKVALSFVDADGARCNYLAEAAPRDFDGARRAAREAWNEALSKVIVSGGTTEQRRVFYTALYHTMIDPRTFTDVDGRYTGGDFAVHAADTSFTKRTVFSGWDVFRSQMPLQCIINPEVVSDIINSLITMATESGRGYLERWELLNAYSGCMLGNPALLVMADAYSRGIRTFDMDKALAYGRESSRRFGNDPLGYTPGNLAISYTLEYAYADWALARLAEMAGHQDMADEFYAKAGAWRNIFDAEKGWFRPREADGTWAPWPDEGRTKEWYGCMEADAYQQGWFVPHDISGMVAAMGGREAVIADLDTFFIRTPKEMYWNAYYNHANEPVHFVPYLYNVLGQPWKTQYWTRFICKNAYHDAVNGLVGNEDVGQMSAWYVLSAAGLHPVCPGDGEMQITSPLFSRVVIRLDPRYYAGRTFTIEAHGLSDEAIYIQRALLNGQPYDRCSLSVDSLAAGGTLELFMGNHPNESWGTGKANQ